MKYVLSHEDRLGFEGHLFLQDIKDIIWNAASRKVLVHMVFPSNFLKPVEILLSLTCLIA